MARNNEIKIGVVLGARPQFIKAAPLSKSFQRQHFQELIIHTGQHYDQNMSDVFFNEMNIPKAKYNLGIGGGLHGEQTGKMLISLEKVFLEEKFHLVVVLGDTNSTLAGALVASKLHIPLAHVEAGLRSFNREMPEEINRVVTDHLSDLLFCPSMVSHDNLKEEGIQKNIHVVGDTMVDALMDFLPKVEKLNSFSKYEMESKKYFLLTIHRPFNADSDENLSEILKACTKASYPVLFPCHPRTRNRAKKVLKFLQQGSTLGKVKMIDPVGYLEMLSLQQNARMILTDSGGIQKEALYLKVPCLTLRSETEWIETFEGGWNQLINANEKLILSAMNKEYKLMEPPKPYGEGHSCNKIVKIISEFLN